MSALTTRCTAAFAAMAAVLALAACGSDSGDDDGDSGGSNQSGSSAFPVTIDTAMGEVTIDKQPTKVVVLDPTMADPVYALGVEPVAVDIDGGAESGFESYPWLEGVIDTAIIDEDLVGEDASANAEAIATYEPDLILAQPHEVQDKSTYEQLSAIAPVVVGVNANDSWDVRLDTVATALGLQDEAATVKQETIAAAQAVTDQAPGLEGATYQWVRYDPDATLHFGNGSVLELFGLVPADNQDNTQNTDAGFSQEQLDELSADVVGIWCYGDCAPLTSDARFAELPAVKNDLVIWPDLALAIAMNSPGPHAIPWLAETIGPDLIAGGANLAG